MTLSADDPLVAPSGFSSKRLCCRCFVAIVCALAAFLFFLIFIPNNITLRYEIENQLHRQANMTIRGVGPSAIPILVEYMSSEDRQTRITAIRVAGDYIAYHPAERKKIVSELCQTALHDKELAVRVPAIDALRSASFPSDEIDNTLLQLISSDDVYIRHPAMFILLGRLDHVENSFDNSLILCEFKGQIISFMKEVELESAYETSKIKTILDKCENMENE